MADALSIPDLEPDADVCSAALAYAGAGWYVLPISRQTKHAGSVLGKGWPSKTSRDPGQIVAWFAGSSDGLALHCGRSGAVVFDVDHPESIPDALAEEIERAKPPAQASRKGDDRQAHYLFTQPPGRSIGNGGGRLGSAWGEVRGRNGIIVVAPTPHEKPDGLYRWLHVGPLPVLGSAVAGLLPDQASAEDAATDAEIDAFLATHTAATRPELIEGVVNRLRTDISRGAGRHPSAVAAVCWALREAQAGLYDARTALAALWPIFRDALHSEPSRTPALEWRGIVAWAIGQAALDNPTATRERLTAAEPFATDAAETTAAEPAPTSSRRVDLTPFLDGTYSPPQPSVGAIRDDSVQLLYPGRWHTCVGLTGSGKTWWALAHVRDEILNAGRAVAYVHFEESSPVGTLARLRALGLPPELIAERFVWLDNERRWDYGDMARELEAVAPGLVILDGINAACTRHGQDPSLPETVGWYRRYFVTPATTAGAAVLSLGHPPKARDRQDERHGYGATGWLDEVDGVGFRLVASKDHPVRRGASGSATLHSVKDRYGEVERRGVLESSREQWYYLGSLIVDDSGLSDSTTIRVSAPSRGESNGVAPDAIDILGTSILATLEAHDRQYPSQRELATWLRADSVTFNDRDLEAALERLERSGRIQRDPYVPRRARAGCCVDLEKSDE